MASDNQKPSHTLKSFYDLVHGVSSRIYMHNSTIDVSVVSSHIMHMNKAIVDRRLRPRLL